MQPNPFVMQTIQLTERRRFANPMHVQPCIERKVDSNGNYVATGNWRPGFEWIQDEGVIVCELVKGMHVKLFFHRGDEVTVSTRRQTGITFIQNKGIYLAIDISKSRQLIPHDENGIIEEKELIGVIPNIGAMTYDSAAWGFPLWIPLSHMIKKMRYGQWGKLPKTVQNVSNWLKEDLTTFLPVDIARKVGCGRPTHNKMAHCARPYGLMFVHPDGRYGRVSCEMFDWYYEEGMGRPRKPKNNNKMTKARWEVMNEQEKEEHRTKARQERRPHSQR